jgi:hypothetical protein
MYVSQVLFDPYHVRASKFAGTSEPGCLPGAGSMGAVVWVTVRQFGESSYSYLYCNTELF